MFHSQPHPSDAKFKSSLARGDPKMELIYHAMERRTSQPDNCEACWELRKLYNERHAIPVRDSRKSEPALSEMAQRLLALAKDGEKWRKERNEAIRERDALLGMLVKAEKSLRHILICDAPKLEAQNALDALDALSEKTWAT